MGPWANAARRRLGEYKGVTADDDNTWLFVYTASLLLSFLATLVASNHMRKLGGDVFRSAVRFVTTSFLICTSVHALAGGLFYAYLIATMDSWIDDVEKYNKKHMMYYNDSGSAGSAYYPPPSVEDVFSGSSSMADDEVVDSLLKPDNKNDGGEAAYLSKLTHDYRNMPPTLTLLLCLENIFFVLGAYWIFLLTRELYKLAKTTHDRGRANERRQIRKYASGAMCILLAFLVCGVVILILHKGYGVSYRFLNMLELSAIIISIVYSCGALFRLRLMGRKNEHIHGMVMASPLYRRLKLMMFVCIIFTLPYSVLQMMLIGVKEKDVDSVPDYIVGIVTMLYYLFGAAQALVMGGSQQCCLRILHPIIPAHVRNSPEWRALQGSRRHESVVGTHDIVEAPKRPVFVNTDIESSSALWADAPQHVIDEAQQVHDDLLRSLLPKFRGYEITTAGDAFQLAFHTVADAVSYCLEAQLQLIQAKWPCELENLLPSTKTEREFGLKCSAIFRGLRVRMGIHDTDETEEGSLISQVHPVTGKTIYIGASELAAREIGDVGFGGQIIVSKRIASWLRANEDKIQMPCIVDYYGTHTFTALDLEMELYEVTPKMIDGRRKYFRKRRAAEGSKVPSTATQSSGSPTALTSTAGSGAESTADDSTVEFRRHESPTEAERRMWTKV